MVAEKQLPHGDLSYRVIGCAYDAFKTVGVGFNEIMYHKIFHQNLLKQGIDAHYKVPFNINYEGEVIASFEIDELIENKLIVELKCIQTDFLPKNYAQILCYLKKTRIRIGLLINFGLHKAYPRRIIFKEESVPDTEQFDKNFLDKFPDKQLMDKLIALTHKINNILGTTYLAKVYQAAFAVEFQRNRLIYQDRVRMSTKIGGIQFSPYEIDYWLIDNALLLGILAGKEHPGKYNLFRMRSYLKNLNLHHGLIVFWSTTKNLQLYGIYEP